MPRLKRWMIDGKSRFTIESSGTTSVPRHTTSTSAKGGISRITVADSPMPKTARARPRSHAAWPGQARREWSDRFFQCRRGLEAHGLAGLHPDRLAGARVQPLARLGLAHGERAETRQGELARLLQFLDDGVHQVAGGAIGRGAGQFRRTLQNLGDEGFGHALLLVRSSVCHSLPNTGPCMPLWCGRITWPRESPRRDSMFRQA